MGESTNIEPASRIEIIDVLRGFALTGILYAHMVIWYTGAALPPAVYTRYEDIFSNIALAIFGAFVFGKFFSVFSFLFGLSFYLQFKKKSSTPAGVYVWRLFLLFLIGLLHHLVWRGDILAIYAVLGVSLLFFRNLPLRLIGIIALLLITNVPTHVYELFLSETPTSRVEFPMAEEAEKYYSLVQNEDFISVLKDNWRSWPAKIEYQLESGRLIMTFGYFLLGLYAGRTGLFTSIKERISEFRRWNEFTKRAVLFLLFLGLLMYLFDLVTIPGIKVVPELQWLASFLFSIYNACLTIFFITGITLLFEKKIYQKILKPLASLGKIALTIYLMQTFFGLLLFYNFGLGLFDQSSPAQNVLMGIVVFFLQLKFSRWWLSRYKQGPVEWVWKGLTNFKFPSIKRAKKSQVT